MKKIVLTILFQAYLLSLSAQKIIDVQIDKIYLEGDEIYFINEGEINTYTCELTSIKLRDFEHSIILDCEDHNHWQENKKPTLLDFNELRLFSEPKEFIELIKNKKFAEGTNKDNLRFNSYIQYFNDHLLSEIRYRNYNNETPEWKFNKAEFWKYIFLRINNKYLFLALVDEDADVIGIIIPKNDEIVFISDDHYKVEGSPIDSVDISRFFTLSDFYRIKKDENGFAIVDKLFQDTIIDKVFDRIKLTSDLILCQNHKATFIYDNKWNVTVDTSLIISHPYNNSFQCIRNNKIQWLDRSGNFQDTFPNPSIGFCGSISSTNRKTYNSSDFIYEYNDTGNFVQRKKRDSILLSSTDSIVAILYLNNSSKHSFNEYSNLHKVFSFPYSTYIIETGKSMILASIKNKRDSLERLLEIEKLLYFQDKHKYKLDSIDIEIENLKDDINIDILFEGNIEPLGYHHPMLFREDNLFGYYPQNKIAKYKKISKFNFFFAEFELESGKAGWLDVYGNEYFKK